MKHLINSEFPLQPDISYLNHAAVSPWPTRTAEAIVRFSRENQRIGASNYPEWLEVEQRLRERLARLIGADSATDIALLKNTSEALSVVAHGIRWQAGENIVGIHRDFPSNRIVWESLADQQVSFNPVDILGTDQPEQALMAACDQHTRLLAVSSVHYATGLRLDLEMLGNFCEQRQILFCVDAIQSLGVIPFDLKRVKADFVAADGHKWMLGPEGLALFYCRPELREQLRLHQFGWHMLESPSDFDQSEWQVSDTATRFECGSPNMLGIQGLEASLSLLEQLGHEKILMYTINNISYLIDLLYNIDSVELISKTDSKDRLSGILSFRVPGIDSEHIHQQLMLRKVVCACRGGGIRFSPHFYTSEEQMDRACQVLAQIIKT
jgi:cysteine desulfurase/selenocysteine lyase